MTDSTLVRTDREGSTAVVTMTNPAKRNALSRAMMRALIDALDGVAADPSIRAVILRGEGPACSAGHDLREISEARGAE
ncbi:MAG: enoyl-CoA hydratase-related protein, partial [Solirubrobacteraceae bacterium]